MQQFKSCQPHTNMKIQKQGDQQIYYLFVANIFQLLPLSGFREPDRHDLTSQQIYSIHLKFKLMSKNRTQLAGIASGAQYTTALSGFCKRNVCNHQPESQRTWRMVGWGYGWPRQMSRRPTCVCPLTVVMVTQTAFSFKTLHLPGGNGSLW